MLENKPRNDFLESLRTFDEMTLRAVSISESRIGVEHTGRQNRVLMAFAKMTTHAMSIHLLCGHSAQQDHAAGLLDHFSIGTLTRSLFDASVMTLYLSEPTLSAAEWDLRRHVLFLHDATNRKRFLQAGDKVSNLAKPRHDADSYRQYKASILKVIEARGKELGLETDRIEELSKGNLVFMNGLRGAVREAGLDLHQFEFIQTYLSSYVHSHPTSLLRTENISFDTPTDFQLDFCKLCLATSETYMDAAIRRVEAFTGHIALDQNGHIQ